MSFGEVAVMTVKKSDSSDLQLQIQEELEIAYLDRYMADHNLTTQN